MNFKTDFYSVLPYNKYDENFAHPLVPSFTSFVPHISSASGIDEAVPESVLSGDYNGIILSNYKDFKYALDSLVQFDDDAYSKVEMGLVIKRHSGRVKHKNKESIGHYCANPTHK